MTNYPKISMLKIYLDILDPEQKKIFEKLRAFGKNGVLGGGTAISLQIKHRRSFDFDIFLPEPIPKTLFKKTQEVFGSNLEKLIDSTDQLTFITNGKTAVTFLYYYFSPLHPLVETEVINLFDLRDLATDKAATIGRRGIWRDYVDLFFLLKKDYIDLSKIIEEASWRFGANFSPKLFLEQLCYFGDIRDFTTQFIKEKYTPSEIKLFFENLVSGYLKTKL